jgi:hypothetical protein
MRVETTLPISTMVFRHWAPNDREVTIILAKARFRPRADGRFIADPEKPELRLEEEFADGQPGYAELKAESDIFPSKPATDLLVRGMARTPDERHRPQWNVSVEIPDLLNYGFQVRGPSEWRKGLTGWSLSDPKPVSEVPLRYGLAYGGHGPSKNDPEKLEAHDLNPCGQGFASSGMLRKGDPIPAPQIGLLGDFNGAYIDKPMTVCGFGAIAKAWPTRLPLAGTFDEDWQENRHPMMPKDYDLRFWNCAPYPLQIDPYLKGDETVILTGMAHQKEPLRMTLPGVGLNATLVEEGEPAETPEIPQTEIGKLRLDVSTVELDVQSRDVANHSMTIVWAGVSEKPFDLATLGAVRLKPKEKAKEAAE